MVGEYYHDRPRTLHLTPVKHMKKIKLGDLIAKITKFLHIPHCIKCEKRRVILNEVAEAGLKETLKKLKQCC